MIFVRHIYLDVKDVHPIYYTEKSEEADIEIYF